MHGQNKEQFEVRDMRHKEKFQIDDLYLNRYAKKVGVYGSAVYMSLCRHSNKNQESYPSLNKLAEEHNCSRSQIIRSVKALEDLNIIRRLRVGKKLNNRYLLIDKSEWRSCGKVCEEPQSEVSGRNITSSPQELHLVSGRNFHSKDTHLRNTHIKGFSSFKEIKPPKRFFRGMEMRMKQGVWYCIPKEGGDWLKLDMKFFKETTEVKN